MKKIFFVLGLGLSAINAHALDATTLTVMFPTRLTLATSVSTSASSAGVEDANAQEAIRNADADAINYLAGDTEMTNDLAAGIAAVQLANPALSDSEAAAQIVLWNANAAE